MRDPRPPEVLRHSIIDRLGRGGDRPRAGGDLRIGVAELKQAVRRDIEWLLNTRRPLLPEVERLPEARTSILAYGLPDVTQFTGSSQTDRQRLSAQIEECLRAFEPRLAPRSLKVEPVLEGEPARFRLNFRIRGELHVDPVREKVTYDTSIELSSGTVQIEATD
jgi:type VI secretion system protein ImpF